MAASADSGNPANRGRQAEPLGACATHTRRQTGSFGPLEQNFPQVCSQHRRGLEARRSSTVGQELVEQRKEDLGKGYMTVLCVPLGPGYSTIADNTGAEMMKIIQTPTLIVILNPDLTYRQIFMDGRALETAPNTNWMGYSVGHWEGDTLVVESLGFNDRTWLDHDGHPHTEALRVTERYRRRNVGNLDIEVTFSDPGAYAKPWTAAVRAELAPDTEMIEWVCNEGRSGLEH